MACTSMATRAALAHWRRTVQFIFPPPPHDSIEGSTSRPIEAPSLNDDTSTSFDQLSPPPTAPLEEGAPFDEGRRADHEPHFPGDTTGSVGMLASDSPVHPPLPVINTVTERTEPTIFPAANGQPEISTSVIDKTSCGGNGGGNGGGRLSSSSTFEDVVAHFRSKFVSSMKGELTQNQQETLRLLQTKEIDGKILSPSCLFSSSLMLQVNTFGPLRRWMPWRALWQQIMESPTFRPEPLPKRWRTSK